MADLLSDASANGFGPDVTVTSSFASVRASGIPENTPVRAALHWSDDGTTFEKLKDTIQEDGVYPVDLT